MKSFSSTVLVVSAVLVGLVFACQARAGEIVIYSDTYARVTSDGQAIAGSSPEVNLPGGSYVGGAAGQFEGTTATGNPAPGLSTTGGTRSQTSIWLPMSSSGSYVKPTVFTVSGDLKVDGVSGSSPTSGFPRGVGFGFYFDDSGYYGLAHFTGLALDSSGTLSLIRTIGDSDCERAVQVAYAGGAFSTANFYTLTYTVDTTTGLMSNVSLSGSTADYSAFNSTAWFTDAKTTYVGVGASSTSGNPSGGFDNLRITMIPEPGTLALLATGLLGLLCYAWRKRK